MKYSDNKFDKFYTNRDIAKLCIEKTFEIIPKNKRQFFIEPSAGSGVFLQFLNNEKYLAFDIEPEIQSNNQNIKIQKKDFLTLTNLDLCDRINFDNTIVIGNPPFGLSSNLAIKFFNKSAEFSNYIAFILPKTFRKISVHNKLNLNFHLIKDFDIPKNSFIYNNEKYDVPTCFQIWEKRCDKRVICKINNNEKLISFVKKNEAEFAIRRVGGRAGKLLDGLNYSESSTYFCKINDKNKEYELMQLLKKIDFSNIVNQTAGVRSLSKIELLNELNTKYERI